MNICVKVFPKVRRYLAALGTGNKNDSRVRTPLMLPVKSPKIERCTMKPIQWEKGPNPDVDGLRNSIRACLERNRKATLINGDGRGSIVTIPTFVKRSKISGEVYRKMDHSRLYATSTRKRKTRAEVSRQLTLSKGYSAMAKLWFRAFKNPNIIFKDLGFFLKLEDV